MTLQAKINKLPSYIYEEDNGERFFLTFNKDIQGNWSIGYVEYGNQLAIHCGNMFDELGKAIDFMLDELSIKA